MVRSVKYERQNLPKRHPQGADINYGYSFALAWVVFAIYVIAALVFLIFSRKRKGDKAADEREAMENEPVHLGRIWKWTNQHIAINFSHIPMVFM